MSLKFYCRWSLLSHTKKFVKFIIYSKYWGSIVGGVLLSATPM
jgi:hypothetical protein